MMGAVAGLFYVIQVTVVFGQVKSSQGVFFKHL